MKRIDYTIINGDAAQMPLADESIDLTVTSPPYDDLRDYQGCVWNFDVFKSVAKELWRVTKRGGVVVWVVGDETKNGSETLMSFRQALFFKEIGFNAHDTMIWNKQGFTAVGSVSIRYAPVFEFMLVFTKGVPKTFNPLKDRKNLKFEQNGNSKQKNKSWSIRQRNGSTKTNTRVGNPITEYGIRFNVWECSPENSNLNRRHPAQFPEKLANDHILSWSNEGDTVLDPFLGSGTTGKMAIINKRKFIGIEISKDYCEIAKARCKRANLEPCDIPKILTTDKPMPLFER